jgi:hypothetical protein
MSGLAIYMEGGGRGKDTKVALRLGMNAFLGSLKEAAHAKAWSWNLVPCGGRDQAYKAFNHARAAGEYAVVVLLVDAEEAVNAGPCAHLSSRDRWNLAGVGDNVMHLMVQVMETWIVADPDALAVYYGQQFRRNALPRTQNLEEVAKRDIAKALERATHDTKKGDYHKIRHASALLKRIDPAKARRRCPSCERLFRDLGHALP